MTVYSYTPSCSHRQANLARPSLSWPLVPQLDNVQSYRLGISHFEGARLTGHRSKLYPVAYLIARSSRRTVVNSGNASGQAEDSSRAPFLLVSDLPDRKLYKRAHVTMYDEELQGENPSQKDVNCSP